jgi:hypothetical protein
MLRRHAALVALLAALALAACGSDNTSDPTPLASPSPASSSLGVNMRLLAQLDLAALTGVAGASGAGNWGYTTPSGRRFALTGTSAGTSIVEVTDPTRPRSVAFVTGPTSAWREIRTWNRTFQSAHSLWIDTDRGLLFANGTRAGGLHVLDVGTNPEDPDDVGSFNDFYIHDSFTRGTTLFAAAISNGFLSILDASNPSRIREITRFNTGGRFTHNAWLTRDGRHVFTTDERPGRPLEGWDITDVLAPRKVSEYIGAPGTIPHNVMIDGDRLLVSHYTEGVHLLDIRDPERPRVLGTYDTYTGTSTGFSGAWGAYIFPASNLIVASDINGGLFVLQYTGS